MRIRISSVFTAGFLLHQAGHEVDAAPNRATVCNGASSSPGGPHLSNAPLNITSLEATPVQFLLNGQALCAEQQTPCSDPNPTLTVGEVYNWEVSGDTYRGLLVRVEALDGGATFEGELLTEDPLLGPADACVAPVVGIDHSSPVDKTSSTGTLRIDAAGQVQIDVNVVFRNNAAEGSAFAHNYFLVNFEAAPTPDTPAPTDAPVTTPDTPAPTDAPDAPADTPAPTAADTPSPTAPASYGTMAGIPVRLFLLGCATMIMDTLF